MVQIYRHIFIFCTMAVQVFSWNLQVRNESMFRAVGVSDDSYFGYSLAVFDVVARAGIATRLIVGSPGSNSFTGAVNHCELVKNGPLQFKCKLIKFHTFESNPLTEGDWFGATVASSKGSALACAPRGNSQVGGECFLSKGSLTEFRRVEFHSNRPLCMAGFSATYMPEKVEADGTASMFVGAPTCRQDYDPPTKPSTLLYPSFTIDEQWHTGYTLASGIYGIRNKKQKSSNSKEFLLVTTGFHAGSSFAGKVTFYNPTTRQQQSKLTGKQPGEQFGASLAVYDINGDERDDIVVGAPHHTDYNSPELKYEIGAVYIYYQMENDTYQQEADFILRGESIGARFGLAVAGVGDLDADGYNDLAVGAPYENQGSGTVYIYQGSKNGLGDRPSQIIFGKNFNPPLTTFGFAIIGHDFDGNKYSDVIVGAYNSSYVTYLPARPIAQVKSELHFLSDRIQLSNQTCDYFNLSASTNKIPVACEEIQFCISYSGVGVLEMKITVTIVLDVNTDKQKRRILFLENQNDEISQDLILKVDSQQCRSKKFFVRPNTVDDVFAMQAKMNIQPTGSEAAERFLIPIIPDQLTNIISKNSVSILTKWTSWWEYVVAALGAIVILAVIIFILHKVGFFKRKLPPTEDESLQTSDPVE